MRVGFGFFSGFVRAGPVCGGRLFCGYFLAKFRKILIIKDIKKMETNTIIYNGKRHNVVTMVVGKNRYDSIKSGKKKLLRLFYTPYWNYLILNFFLMYTHIAMCYKCKGELGQVYVELRGVRYDNAAFQIELGRIIK